MNTTLSDKGVSEKLAAAPALTTKGVVTVSDEIHPARDAAII